MDVLADVLAVTRFSNTTLCQVAFTAPWGIEFTSAKRATFHIVSRGSCWLIIDDTTAPIRMVQGDVVLLPHGRWHAMADPPDTPMAHYTDVAQPMCFKSLSDDISVALFCGAYYFEQDGPHPLLSLLPPVIYLPANQAQSHQALQTMVRQLMYEQCSADQPGNSAVIARLMDVLFIYMVRAWLAKQPDDSGGWLGALRDPKIGKILSLMHGAPEQRWTVESLAKTVSMSRAAFAKRFSTLVGQAPLSYLKHWRLDLAAKLLKTSTLPISTVATTVGYESETSFSKTFRQSRGMSPGQYRAVHRDETTKETIP